VWLSGRITAKDLFQSPNLCKRPGTKVRHRGFNGNDGTHCIFTEVYCPLRCSRDSVWLQKAGVVVQGPGCASGKEGEEGEPLHHPLL
jgi:hypothetical protein